VVFSSSSFEQIANAAVTFIETFTGQPAAPQPYLNPDNWDIFISGRTSTDMIPMQADHGSDCGAPPAQHPISLLNDAVFICKDHVMTAIFGGYGAIYMTPPALMDLSSGESVLRWDQSTRRTSSRDWIDIVIAPLTNGYHPLSYTDHHAPNNAVHLDLAGGSNVFVPTERINGVEQKIDADLYTTWDSILQQNGLAPDAARRDTFELRLSQSHIKLCMPNYNAKMVNGPTSGPACWIDTNLPTSLPWDRATVQINHRTYNPEKACANGQAGDPSEQTDQWGVIDNPYGATHCPPNTWHWDNVSISPAAPLTVIHGVPSGQTRNNINYIDQSTADPTINFPAATPAGAQLHFVGNASAPQISVNAGQTWFNAVTVTPDAQCCLEVGDAWVTDIPAGTTSVKIRAGAAINGNWALADFSVWSTAGPGVQQSFTATATPTPTPPSTATPASGTATPTPRAASGAGTQTLTFDDLSNPNRPFSGQYPANIIDWGTNRWYLSTKYGGFTSQSIGFNGSGPTSSSFTFVSPGRLLQLDAWNGGNTSSSISLSCPGQVTVQQILAAGSGATLQTGWTANCASVAIGSTNGWLTNFDNLVIAVSSNPSSTNTPTPTATSVPPTRTPTPTNTPLPALRTITFDDQSNPNRALNGQYPTGVVDWGTTTWYLSGPYGAFMTNSIGFGGSSRTSANFTLLGSRRLVKLDAYNGGTTNTVLTISCAGQSTVSVTLAAKTQTTLTTGWSQACANVAITSSNGWKTNFDNLVIDSSGSSGSPTNTPTRTPLPSSRTRRPRPIRRSRRAGR
jgi:hypothetical protein